MQIIDAISEVPGLKIKGNRGKMQHGFECQIFEADKEKSLSEWAVDVSKNLLLKNNISADDLGVIINASISLYDTTSMGNTSAPGIGHEVQKHLSATNAFVFEMFHNDLGNMIKIASDFLTHMDHQYALIIQSNKFSTFLKDDENGFCIPDGVNALLIKSSNKKIELENIHISHPEMSKASLSFNAGNENALKNNHIFSLNWNYDPLFKEALNSEMKNILSNLKDSQATIITEKWFSEHLSSQDTENAVAMNTIPSYLQEHSEIKKQPITLISYNPFLAHYSILKITHDEI